MNVATLGSRAAAPQRVIELPRGKRRENNNPELLGRLISIAPRWSARKRTPNLRRKLICCITSELPLTQTKNPESWLRKPVVLSLGRKGWQVHSDFVNSVCTSVTTAGQRTWRRGSFDSDSATSCQVPRTSTRHQGTECGEFLSFAFYITIHCSRYEQHIG